MAEVVLARVRSVVARDRGLMVVLSWSSAVMVSSSRLLWRTVLVRVIVDWVGVLRSRWISDWGEAWVLFRFEGSIFMLVRRASSRESTRCVFVGSGSILCARLKRRSSPVSRDAIGKCRNAIASRLLDRARSGGRSAGTGLEADRAIQSSVRLLHMLSALLLS